MACRGKKLLGVRIPSSPTKKWQQKRNQGMVRNVVDGFKSLRRKLQGAKHTLLNLLAERLHLEPFFSNHRKALTYRQDKTAEQHAVVRGTILSPMVGWDLKMQKKTIVLDLDETLIHSSEEPLKRYDFAVEVVTEGELETFCVLKRPGVDELLKELANKYELVLFTAAVREYADAVLDRIDPHRAIRYRLYRDSCTEMSGKFVNDLSLLGRDLKRVVIVDDNPNAYLLHPENAIPVNSFVDDLYDMELASVVSFFKRKVVQHYEDVREALRYYVAKEYPQKMSCEQALKPRFFRF